ncbi:phospholipase D-like domain-containing protein [Burkholderia pseudomallei]|nr:phospholipase D/transphosphatidylase [Burkholderia pseudomallei]
MTQVFNATASAQGLTVKAYGGDRCVLLAFSLADHLTDRLAGFAIRRAPASTQQWTWLGNRLNFEGAYNDPKVSKDGKFFVSNEAPFQKFWWVDFPADGTSGSFCYEVLVKRFKDPATTELIDDQKVDVTIDVGPFKDGDIEVAFTRGYLSSQAYADKFHNAPFQPKSDRGDWDFATGPFKDEWIWLGGHARQAIVDFFNDCHADKTCTLDAFVYDLNEPDIIEALKVIANEGRLRLLADDDPKQHGDQSVAYLAFQKITGAAPEERKQNFKRGHFSRYQHNKVLVKRDANGNAIRVLTGSTNFSITGLYVNANHVVVFDNADVARMYGEAFQTAFEANLTTGEFEKSTLSQKEFPVAQSGLPKLVLSFAPHKKPTFSLNTLVQALKDADSSVIFAVMDLGGGGEVLQTLSKLHSDAKIFSYGISDQVNAEDNTVNGTKVYTATSPGELVYSKEDPEKFPPPFNTELQVHGAMAHVIHHKFVVVDFNGANPVVFGGSSNLAEGGEQSNGDNLFAIYDRAIATAFAIEGIRLVDHYAFAAALKRSEAGGAAPTPLCLKMDEAKWYAPFYEDGNIRKIERLLFTR